MSPVRPRSRLRLIELERRDVPSRPLLFPVIYAGAETGAPPAVKAFDAETGAPPAVKAFDAETGAVIFERTVYEAAFSGGVRVATADFTADGWPDLVVAPGAGGGPRVRVLDGKTGDPVPGPLGDFFAYEPSFKGGVEVAAADVDGDRWPDLIVTAGKGGGPRVRVFDGKTGAVMADFMAFDPGFRGGASVAAADFTGDGKAEVAVGAGPGGGPHVKVYDVATRAVIPGPLGSFFAYESSFKGGVHVGADWKAGDVTGDGRADLLVGPGAGRAPVVKVYSGRTGTKLREFAAFEPSVTAGVRVAAAYVTDDAYADVVAATAQGVADRIRVFDGRTSEQIDGPTGEFAPFGGGRTGGVTIAASNDPPGGATYLPLPTGEEYDLEDAFDPELTKNGAKAAVTVQPISDGRYLWEYHLTNLSEESEVDPTMYNELFDYFSLGVGDATGIVAPGAAVYQSPSGGGSVTWHGLEIEPGETRTVTFTQPARPVVLGSGSGCSETDPPLKYGMEMPETTYVNGQVPVPGKLPTVSIAVPKLIPVNANNDNFKLEIDADTGQATNEADRWLSVDQPFIPKVRDFTVSTKIGREDPQLIPVVISVTGTDKAGLLKASVTRKGQGDARLFKEKNKDGGLFTSVELPITDPATGTKLWSKTVYIEGTHESAALDDLAVEASFKQGPVTADAPPKDVTVTPVIMSLETKTGPVSTLDDETTGAWVGVQAAGKTDGGTFIPGIRMTADVVNGSAAGPLDIAYVQNVTDTSGAVDGGAAMTFNNGQKLSFRIAPAYANDPDPAKRATFPLLDAPVPGTNPIYNSGPNDRQPEVVSADPSRKKFFLEDSPAWRWNPVLSPAITKLDRRKSFATYLVVRYTDDSLYPIAYTSWAFTIYVNPANRNIEPEVTENGWIKPKHDPPAKTRPPVANTTYFGADGKEYALIQQYPV